jgi:ketosteroid isomerase-like protein
MRRRMGLVSERAGGRTVSNQSRKQVVSEFLTALVNDDSAAMRPLVADEVKWWIPQSGAVAYGLARPLDGWEQVPWFGGDGWKGFKPNTSHLEIHHVVAEDDLVSAHYSRTALRANGNAYEAEYNILFRFSDDLIVEVWEVVDTAQANASR